MPVNLRALLEEMIEKDASDLHLVAGERPKLRVDGDITSASSEDVMTPKDTLSLAYSVLTENQKKRFETENELDLDRKSTRLNSSHGYISYAVFCLKKKKKKV